MLLVCLGKLVVHTSSIKLPVVFLPSSWRWASAASASFKRPPIRAETTLSVTIEDPTATELPPGWIGFGDEDPDTFEPILPDGASFASVLASVDEFSITGAVPGFFFGNAFWDVQVDNITVNGQLVPEPTGGLLLLIGLLALRRR